MKKEVCLRVDGLIKKVITILHAAVLTYTYEDVQVLLYLTHYREGVSGRHRWCIIRWPAAGVILG